MARLYADAFAADPRLEDDLRAGHRYLAARWAVLAGCCRGSDSAGLGEPELRRWRRQARQWLRADLVAWSKRLEDPAAALEPVQTTLSRWRDDPDLAGLREPAELNKLSAEERKDWLSLWDEVGIVIARTEPVK